MIGNVEGEGLLEEPEADIVLSDRVQDQTNVGVDQGKFGMILAGHQKSKISGSKWQG